MLRGFRADLLAGIEGRGVTSQGMQTLLDHTSPLQVDLRGVIIHILTVSQATAVRVNSITLEHLG
jgi:hypothetical protein